MRRYPANNPESNKRDPQGYSRFICALKFDDVRKYQSRLFRDSLLFVSPSLTPVERHKEDSIIYDVQDSFIKGTFESEYLTKKEEFLSKKAIRKFFK